MQGRLRVNIEEDNDAVEQGETHNKDFNTD